mgnify:CR=1 FL=1
MDNNSFLSQEMFIYITFGLVLIVAILVLAVAFYVLQVLKTFLQKERTAAQIEADNAQPSWLAGLWLKWNALKPMEEEKTLLLDHDFDGIESRFEDINGNNDPLDDDTDSDGTPDCFDIDDDGDSYTTESERRTNLDNSDGDFEQYGKYYPFENIPTCDREPVTTTNKRRHLDNKCTPKEYSTNTY